MKKPIITLAAVFGVYAGLENEASAGPFFTEIIPASACQLENEDDIGKAELVDGSWQIEESITSEEVELLCPVRSPPFYWLGLAVTDLVWSHIEIFYRDPDGSSTSHSVVATLKKITRTGGMPSPLYTITSNGSLNTSDTRKLDEMSMILGAALDDQAQHFVQVKMKQGPNIASERVRFTRIRLLAEAPG